MSLECFHIRRCRNTPETNISDHNNLISPNECIDNVFRTFAHSAIIRVAFINVLTLSLVIQSVALRALTAVSASPVDAVLTS